MAAADDYPLLADFASRPSGRYPYLVAKRSEARAALDEIERLRAEVETWRTAAQGAGAQAVRLRELIHALNIRTVRTDEMVRLGHFLTSLAGLIRNGDLILTEEDDRG